MIRIGYIFLHPLSGSPGSTVRLLELADSLSKNNVTNFIFSPYENDRNISNRVHLFSIPTVFNKSLLSNLVYKSTRFLYYNKSFRRKIIRKVFNENFFLKEISYKAINKIKKLKIDLDIIQAEQDISIIPSLLISRKLKVPVILDLHNIMSEELVAAKVINYDSFEYKFFTQKMKEYLQMFDKIFVVSDEMKNYVERVFGVDKKRVLVVSPGGKIKLREIPKRDKPFKLIFAGFVTYREHVDLFLRSIPFIKKEINDIEIYITNRGDDLTRIKKLAKKLKLKINFFWFENIDDLREFMKTCHIGILPSSDDMARRMGTPVKLFDYLSLGLPVVANDIGGWSKIIVEENVGKLTQDNPQDFANKIINILKRDTYYYNTLATNAIKCISSKYNWDESAKKAFNAYKEII